jgi:hypothetical protein
VSGPTTNTNMHSSNGAKPMQPMHMMRRGTF